mmetsp:Transcript_21951/g.55889  ORF Transcript_21951/g.55889 Transcript_21951/m.55889 type:complete len:224 (-) Transcript_21951:10-681(-)
MISLRLPPAFIVRMPSSSPSHTTFWKGRWPYLKATGFLPKVSRSTWSPMETLALKPTMLPTVGLGPLVAMSWSTYLRPEGVVTVSPVTATGPVSRAAFKISLPSTAASRPTIANPPTSPKRREMKPVAVRTGSNWLKPAPPPSCLLPPVSLDTSYWAGGAGGGEGADSSGAATGSAGGSSLMNSWRCWLPSSARRTPTVGVPAHASAAGAQRSRAARDDLMGI